MNIRKIRLLRFRNYADLTLEGFSPGINLIYGKNAQGKTNLIEAVHICSNGKSFRTPYDYTTVMDGCDNAYISTCYEAETGAGTVEALIEKNRKKSFKKNGVPLKSAKELFGNILTVIFSPEDLRTIKESPALRRSFLDSEISKLRPAYVDTVKRYNEIIAQKNAAIRAKGAGAADLLRAYNGKLKDYINTIIENRAAYVNKLNGALKEIHERISGSGQNVSVKYETQVSQDIGAQLESLINKEISEMGCNTGPHRDELRFIIDGREAKQYASQGQLRTLMLSAKISCVKIIEQNTGKTPVLLLDDVFSELDSKRQANLLGAIAGTQTFITGCGNKIKGADAEYTTIKVENGKAEVTRL